MNEDFDKKLQKAGWPVRANLDEAGDALKKYKEGVDEFGKLVHEHAQKQLDHSAEALKGMPTDYEPEDELLLTDKVPPEKPKEDAGA